MEITVSTVTPIYSGEKFLPELIEELSKLKQRWEQQPIPLTLTEAIFVCDNPIDDSHRTLKNLQSQHPWIKVITLSRNYGQHAATVAGICHTATDWVVTLDEDMQHRPEQIETLFLEQTKAQSDIVYAHPKAAPHGNSWRDKSSKLVKRLLAKLSTLPQIKDFNSFRLIRGSIARAAASSSSSQTYLDIAISWFTTAYTTVQLPLHDQRYTETKTSGYGLLGLIRHARRLILSSHIDIAATGILIGGLTTLTAFIFGSIVVIQRLFFPAVIDSAGWASIISLQAFLGGIIIILLCVILEYINVMVINQLGKPTFFTINRETDQYLKDWANKTNPK